MDMNNRKMMSIDERRKKRWDEFAKLSGDDSKVNLKFEVRVAYDIGNSEPVRFVVSNGELSVGFLKNYVINQHLNDRKLEIGQEEFAYRRNNMRLIFNGIELKDDDRTMNQVFRPCREDKVHCGIAVIPKLLSNEEEEEEEKQQQQQQVKVEKKEEHIEEQKTNEIPPPSAPTSSGGGRHETDSFLVNLQRLQLQALTQIDQWRQRAQYFANVDPTESARARSLSRDWENRLGELNTLVWNYYHEMMSNASGMMLDSVINGQQQQQQQPAVVAAVGGENNNGNNRFFANQILIFIDIRLLLKLGLLVLILSQDGGKERMLFLIACACIVYMYQTRLFEIMIRGRIGNENNNVAQQQQQQQPQDQQEQQQQVAAPSMFSPTSTIELFRTHFIAGVIRRNTNEWWERLYDTAYIILGFTLSFLPMWRPHTIEEEEEELTPLIPVAAPDDMDIVEEKEEEEEKKEEDELEDDNIYGNENQTGLRRRRPHRVED